MRYGRICQRKDNCALKGTEIRKETLACQLQWSLTRCLYMKLFYVEKTNVTCNFSSEFNMLHWMEWKSF